MFRTLYISFLFIHIVAPHEENKTLLELNKNRVDLILGFHKECNFPWNLILSAKQSNKEKSVKMFLSSFRQKITFNPMFLVTFNTNHINLHIFLSL